MSSLLVGKNLADMVCHQPHSDNQSPAEGQRQMIGFFTSRFWVFLLAIGAVGLALLVVANFWMAGVPHLLVSEIGIALVSATVIGATVHLWMTHALRHEVVKATLTAVLPPIFHTELLRLFGDLQ